MRCRWRCRWSCLAWSPSGPTAWLLGTEAAGLSEQALALADRTVRVPLHGRAESLNLASAAAVCLYASARAHRQRGVVGFRQAHAHHLLLTAMARRQVQALFGPYDVLLAPSSIGEAPAGLDGTGDPLFCRSWTLLGLPCVHLPFARGRTGLPLGQNQLSIWRSSGCNG